MTSLAVWWLTALLLGLAAFPLAFALFARLHDRGYGLSKALSLLLVGYAVWLLGYSGAPMLRLTIVLMVGVLVVAGGYAAYRQRRELRAFLTAEWPSLLAMEGVFLLTFALWGAVRLYDPHISGTEKPMDFGFMNAALRSEHFPPQDMWLSGFSISYYYFGYVIMAMATRLTDVPSAEGYNLALALIPALVASGTCGIVFSLVRGSGGSRRRAIAFGALGVVLFLLISNLAGALEFVRARGLGAVQFWRWIGIKGLEGPVADPSWAPHDFWWWWRSTRLIDTVANGQSLDYTITEFPFFSFLLGDMHPHVMALPFGLLVVGLALNLLRGGIGPRCIGAGEATLSVDGLVRRPFVLLAMCLVIGAMGFLNSWDLPAYGAVFAIAALLHGHLLRDTPGVTLPRIIGGVALVFLGAIVLYLPFYLHFNSQASGILPVRGPGTRLLHYMLFWGVLLFLGASLLARRAWEAWRERPAPWRELRLYLLAAFGLFLAWIPVEFVRSVLDSRTNEAIWGSILSRFINVLPMSLLVAAGFFVLVRLSARRERRDDLFALMLVTLGFGLTLVPELFFLKDFFGSRMNTMFKVYYQAWALLAVGSAYALHALTEPWGFRGPATRYVWTGAGILLLAASLYYPATAIPDKTRSFSGAPTLDGIAFVRDRQPAEYEAIAWLQRNVQGTPVILEAVGDDYTEFGRISGRTGLPTLLAWPGHELQWRGSAAPQTGRREAVDEIYKTQDPARARELLAQYNVEYVYVGAPERRVYGEAGLAKFATFMDRAWEKDEVVIYRARGR